MSNVSNSYKWTITRTMNKNICNIQSIEETFHKNPEKYLYFEKKKKKRIFRYLHDIFPFLTIK